LARGVDGMVDPFVGGHRHVTVQDSRSRWNRVAGLCHQRPDRASDPEAAVVLCPGDVVQRHEAAGYERVAAEEDRDGRLGRGLREAAQERLLDSFPGEEVTLEAVLARRLDAHVRL